jgi:uncharacterized protein (DUF697 family)
MEKIMVDQQTIPLVDLVIVIDTSTSMSDEARALSEAAQAAIEAARSSCPSDLRVTWLGIEGTWKGTNFNQTVRDYLVQEAKAPEAELRGRKRGAVAGGGAQEDAARIIEDISTHFDWRPGTARAIFYLGDEVLEGGGDKTEQKDIDAANKAIGVAREAKVTVHTYFGTSKSKFKDTIQKEYARVAQETGGKTFTDQNTISGFAAILENVICGSRSAGIPEKSMPADNPATVSYTITNDLSHGTIHVYCATMSEEVDPMVFGKTDEAMAVVRRYLGWSAGAGLIPLPGLDLTAIIGVQLRMISQLANLYHVPFSRNLAKSLIGSLLGGFAGYGLGGAVGSLLKGVPLIGTVAGLLSQPALAAAATYAVGKIFVQHFETGGTLLDFDPERVRDHFRQEFEMARARPETGRTKPPTPVSPSV